MALVNLSIANAILKEDYLGPLREQLNFATPVLDRLEKNTRDIVGLEAWIPTVMRLSQAAGARAEDTQLPASSRGTYKEVKASLKHYYGSLQVTGPVMRQTEKGDKGSFGRIVDMEAKGMKETLALILAHDIYMGHTLATCGTTNGSATCQLATTSNMNYFKVGMLVDVITTSTGTPVSNGDGVGITAVDAANYTITLDGGTVTTTSSHSVVRDTTYGACCTGLSDIISDATDDIDIYSVNTSDYTDAWVATHDGTVGDLTELAMQSHLDKIVTASGKFPTAIYADYLMQRTYWNLLKSNKMYTEPTPPKVLSGGFRSLEYVGGGSPIPIIADRLMPYGTLYFVHEPDLQIFSPADFDFITIGGDVWLPDILGSTPKDNWKAVLYRDFELGCYRRNSHGKMTGITVAS
jgi:hypothetical protein